MISDVVARPPYHYSLYRRCAAALGPSTANCIGAAVQLGVNPYADASCVASALKDITNPPSTCVGCAATIKAGAKKAGTKVRTGAHNAKAGARAGASSVKAGVKAKAQTLGQRVKSKVSRPKPDSPGTELSQLPAPHS
ncbi:hypothetical protein C0991_002851 [Blastosporella zonata]|nr:hypothetical protein C0991_002851 [Blastosporella zonata]